MPSKVRILPPPPAGWPGVGSRFRSPGPHFPSWSLLYRKGGPAMEDTPEKKKANLVGLCGEARVLRTGRRRDDGRRGFYVLLGLVEADDMPTVEDFFPVGGGECDALRAAELLDSVGGARPTTWRGLSTIVRLAPVGGDPPPPRPRGAAAGRGGARRAARRPAAPEAGGARAPARGRRGAGAVRAVRRRRRRDASRRLAATRRRRRRDAEHRAPLHALPPEGRGRRARRRAGDPVRPSHRRRHRSPVRRRRLGRRPRDQRRLLVPDLCVHAEPALGPRSGAAGGGAPRGRAGARPAVSVPDRRGGPRPPRREIGKTHVL